MKSIILFSRCEFVDLYGSISERLSINFNAIQLSYSKLEDVEISGLFASILAWGNRKSIIKNATNLMERMDNSPFDFITNFQESDLNTFTDFKHRTFNAQDCTTFAFALQRIYKHIDDSFI